MHEYAIAIRHTRRGPRWFQKLTRARALIVIVYHQGPLDDCPKGDSVTVEIEHGITPTAPTIMRCGSASIDAGDDRIRIVHPDFEITFKRKAFNREIARGIGTWLGAPARARAAGSALEDD